MKTDLKRDRRMYVHNGYFLFLPWLEYWGLQQQPQTNTSWLLFEQQLHFHQVHAVSKKKTKTKIQLCCESSKEFKTGKNAGK